MLLTRPPILLRLEGAGALILTLLLYREHGSSWWLFALLLLAPDISMLGYVRNTQLGAATYNLAHTTVLPIALVAASFLTDWDLGVTLALIWLAHIAMDRAIGYGLKLPTGFKETHLG